MAVKLCSLLYPNISSSLAIIVLVMGMGLQACTCVTQDDTVTAIGYTLLEYTVTHTFPSAEVRRYYPYTCMVGVVPRAEVRQYYPDTCTAGLVPILCNILSQLNVTHFREVMCPLYTFYHRFYGTLNLLSENATVNVPLIIFLLEKNTESACEKVRHCRMSKHVMQIRLSLQVKSECVSSQYCSNISCNISFIATFCLKMELLHFIEANLYTFLPTEGREELIQSWMRLHLSNDSLSDGTLSNLSSTLGTEVFINCTVPDGANVAEIVCTEIDI